MTEPAKITCAACFEPLEGEELENPRHDGDRIICDRCYHENYSERCELCENTMDLVNVKYIFLPFGDDRKLEPGIYEIMKLPYFVTDCLGSFEVITGYVKKVAEITEILSGEKYEHGGYICEDCLTKTGVIQT